MKNKELSDKEIEFLNSLSIEEARGFTIERLYEIEMIIDELIIKYFTPNNEYEFKLFLLNGNIIDRVTCNVSYY